MELKEFIYEDCLIPGYYIRDIDGQMFSKRRPGTNRFNCHNKQLVCYGGEMRKIKGSRAGKYTMYCLSKKYTHKDDGRKGCHFKVPAHRAVMETFSPFSQNLPDSLVDEWSTLSSIVKSMIIDGFTVDHKENLNEGFNGLSNLQWMSRSDNAKKGNKQPTSLEKLLWN